MEAFWLLFFTAAVGADSGSERFSVAGSREELSLLVSSIGNKPWDRQGLG